MWRKWRYTDSSSEIRMAERDKGCRVASDFNAVRAVALLRGLLLTTGHSSVIGFTTQTIPNICGSAYDSETPCGVRCNHDVALRRYGHPESRASNVI